MPHIEKNTRKEDIDQFLCYLPNNLTDGEINYIFTKVLLATDPKRYTNFNSLMGVLFCCALEFYRKVVAPYEDHKIIENQHDAYEGPRPNSGGYACGCPPDWHNVTVSCASDVMPHPNAEYDDPGGLNSPVDVKHGETIAEARAKGKIMDFNFATVEGNQAKHYSGCTNPYCGGCWIDRQSFSSVRGPLVQANRRYSLTKKPKTK